MVCYTGHTKVQMYLIKALLVFSLDWFSFAEDFCVWGDNTVGQRLCLHYLEFHTSHASPHQEGIILVSQSESESECAVLDLSNKAQSKSVKCIL